MFSYYLKKLRIVKMLNKFFNIRFEPKSSRKPYKVVNTQKSTNLYNIIPQLIDGYFM